MLSSLKISKIQSGYNYCVPLDVLVYCFVKGFVVMHPQNSKKLQQSEKDIMIGDVGWHIGNYNSINIASIP